MDASRFDALARAVGHRPSRRRFVGLLAGLGLGGVLPRLTAHPAGAATCESKTCPSGQCKTCEYGEDGKLCTCWCGTCRYGIAGGGAVSTAGGGETNLVLVATRTENLQRPGVFFAEGRVVWTDPVWEGTGLTLESLAITFYGPLPDVEGGRAVAGWMQADKAPGEHPFVLHAVDAGPPGSGDDTVALWVGDAVSEDSVLAELAPSNAAPGGFRYLAEGRLVAGDLNLVSLAVPAAASEATPSAL